MLKGFKDFLLRGNVVDLAVAVVIGAAFAAVIKSLVDNIITPILNSIPGAKSNGLGFFLKDHQLSTFVNVSAIINALVAFVITAAVVYFIFVLPMNRLAERRKRGEEPEPDAPTEDVILLTEIRDLLARQQPTP